MRRKFYFLEPSKVATQHIYLLGGYLRALANSQTIARDFDLIVCASKSTLSNLPASLISRLHCVRVFVMNPEKRRLIIKTLVEFSVVLWRMWRLRQGDVLFVSCVLPTTFVLIEFANRVLKRSGIYVVLHGEIEGLYPTSRQSILSNGYWAAAWLRLRAPDSLISLVVLDDFIKDRLVHSFPEKLRQTNVFVVHHPVFPLHTQAILRAPPTVGFLGYRTRAKSFESFAALAAQLPSMDFVAIGGGKVEDLRSGAVQLLAGKDAYLDEIARCTVACFPYTASYTCCLSASALDALAAGVQILAMDRPFFSELASYFGPDVVVTVANASQLAEALPRFGAGSGEQGRLLRLRKVAESKFGVDAVQRSFEALPDVCR